jgi:hypothetical protein
MFLLRREKGGGGRRREKRELDFPPTLSLERDNTIFFTGVGTCWYTGTAASPYLLPLEDENSEFFLLHSFQYAYAT